MRDKKAHSPFVIALLFGIPILLVVGVFIYNFIKNRPEPGLPPVSFLDEAELVSEFESEEYKGPYQNLNPPTAIQQRNQPAYSESLRMFPLDDGNIMIAGFPRCMKIDPYGTEMARIELEELPDEIKPTLARPANPLLSDSGISEQLPPVYEIATRSNGSFVGMHYEIIPTAVSFVEWDTEGKFESVIDLQEYFGDLFKLSIPGSIGGSEFLISLFNEKVLIGNNAGKYVIIENGSVTNSGTLETLTSDWVLTDLFLCDNYILAGDIFTRVVKYTLDGKIDWNWIKNTNHLFQTDESLTYVPSGRVKGAFFVAADGKTFACTSNSVQELKNDGSTNREIGDETTIESLKSLTTIASGQINYLIPEQNSYQAFNNDQIGNPMAGVGVINQIYELDQNFSVLKPSVITLPSDFLNPPSTEPPTDSTGQNNSQLQTALLSPGDTIDLAYMHKGFKPIDTGYIGVDYTGRRAFETDKNLTIISSLDRVQISNGLTQDIQEIDIDSRGYTYMLDRNRQLVQVLDNNGDYLRKYMSLGYDLFGEPLLPKHISVDALDRLWVNGPDRIYVLDKDGNLLKIFERRGATYSRPPQNASNLPSENTPLGYTILPSSSVIANRADPTSPVTLEIAEIEKVIVNPGDIKHFYIIDTGHNQVVIYNMDGTEEGGIEISDFEISGEFGFACGPDGYCYLVDPGSDSVKVLDNLGNYIKSIAVSDLPETGWHAVEMNASNVMAGMLNMPVEAWINADGELVIFDRNEMSLKVWQIRE
jgi:hypothetical protein